MSKQYETINKQIELLKSKGLKFKNEKEAKRIILRENYYFLTTGYEDIFLNLKKTSNMAEIFEEETYFEELYAIYNLDRELKNLIFDYINMVETNIKSYIAYEYTEKYGEKDFLKRENFMDNLQIDSKFQKLKEQVDENLQRNFKDNNSEVKAFLDKNNYLPPLLFVKVFTFGNMTTLYSMMKEEDKQKVAVHLNVSPYSLEKYLKMLNIVRNICAHGDILFNLKLNITLDSKDCDYHKLFQIPIQNERYKYGINDLFAIMLILKKILSKEDFYKMFIKIENLLICVKEVLDDLSYKNLLKTMGFPQNYKLLYHIEEGIKENVEYIPNPINTTDVVLDDEILELAEMLAKNTHEIWAIGRKQEGWKYGTIRDDNLKTTPCLVEYEDLPENEKEYDRNTAIVTLKLIQKLGFRIVKEDK